MQSIPNQPIYFETSPGVSPFPSETRCRKGTDPGPCHDYILSDVLYHQWKRSRSEESLICSLADPTLSPNLIVNGHFDEGDTGWVLGPNIVVDGGEARHTTGGTNTIECAMETVALATYRVKFKVTSSSAGASAVPYVGQQVPGNEGTTITEVGEYSMLITMGVGILQIFSFQLTGDISIDEISVRKITGTFGCWSTAEGAWEMTDQGITPYGVLALTLSTALVVGKHYVLILDSRESMDGHVLIRCGSVVVDTVRPGISEYHFVASDTVLDLKPNGTWSGVIREADLREVETFTDGYLNLENISDESIVYEMTEENRILYENDYATLAVQFSEIEDFQLGCYRLVHLEGSGHPIRKNSNCFKVHPISEGTEGGGCLRKIEAWCDCEGLGFYFRTFRLRWRSPWHFSSPKYPFQQVLVAGTDGKARKAYSQRGKSWKVTVEDMDEPGHDATSAALACDYIQVDGVPFIFKEGSYDSSGFDDDKNDLTAQATFELCPEKDIIFNRSAGCRNEVYYLRVLTAWNGDAGSGYLISYKAFDRCLYPDGITFTHRIDSVIVNGIQKLGSGAVYKNYTMVGFSPVPASVVAPGVNGNGLLAGIYSWRQNLNIWLNSLIDEPEVLQFFDDMSVVQYLEGTTFEIIISRRDPVSTSLTWRRDKYTNDGRFNFSGGDWVLIHPYNP